MVDEPNELPLSLPGSQAGDCCLQVSTKCPSACRPLRTPIRDMLRAPIWDIPLLQHKKIMQSKPSFGANTAIYCNPSLDLWIFYFSWDETSGNVTNPPRPCDLETSAIAWQIRQWFQHVSNLQQHDIMMELLSEFIIKSEHLWSGSFWLTFFYRHFEAYHDSHLTFMGDHTPLKLFQWCMFVQGRNVQRGLVSPLIPNFQEHGIS